jgi:hypothetical protein
MKSDENWRSNCRAGDLLLLGIWALLLALALTGCAGTIRPAVVTRNAASWDGTNQNSGFLMFTNGGALITSHARDRYNGLIGTYGARFVPPLAPDAGVQAAGIWYQIDAEHLADFCTMERWRREGK